MFPTITSRIRRAALIAAALLLSACSDQPQPPAAVDTASVAEPAPGLTSPVPAADKTPASSDTAFVEIEWDALIPDDYRPDKLMEEYGVDDLADDDPKAAELMEKLRELWDQAPVRPELDGRAVKLPGFVVPIEGDAQETTSFLLVPYYGACVHVPPPPANQTVYVLTEPEKGIEPGLFDVVWVSGTMSVERVESDLAKAGYTLYASAVTPYE